MRKPAVLLCAVVAPLLAAFTAALPAHAGPPGSWTTVANKETNTAEPGLLRTPDGVLHVLWQRDDGTSESLWHTRIGEDGAVIGVNAVVTDWDAIQNTPRLVPTGTGGLRAVFSGIRDASPPTEFHDTGRIYTAVSDSTGISWTLPDEALSNDQNALDFQPGAGALSDGTPVTAWGSNDGGFLWHLGTETDPASSLDGDATTGGCCSYGAAVATVGDEAWAAYYSNTAGKLGVWVRQFAPAVGAPMKAPHSTVPDHGAQHSISQESTQAFVSSEDGDVFLAYLVGYPTAGHIELWNVSTGAAVSVPRSRGATDVGMGRGPDGRLWIAWLDAGDHVRAVRTGTSGTGFGGVRRLAAAGPNAYDVFVEGSGPKADVFVNTGKTLKHQQVLPGLNVGAKPTAWPHGKSKTVQFSVRDAGVPIEGATVSALGKDCTTTAAGTCALTFPASKPKTFVATAKHAGYAAGKVGLRVQH